MNNTLSRRILAGVLMLVLAGGIVQVIRSTVFAPKTITAIFTNATAIYPGDEVRVAGVAIGEILAIDPSGTYSKVQMHIDRDVPVPDNSTAVIVAPNLVSARYIQLAPPSKPSTAVLPDSAVIPIDRTAVPVEWDEVKNQLMRLATDLGPRDDATTTSMGRFIDSAANAMAGNGDKLRDTISELSGVGRILSEGSGNIVDVLKNLQVFVSALQNSNQQIVQFNNRLATLSSVIDGSRTELDAALTNLARATGDIEQFVAETRDKTSEQVQRLANVTQTLVDHRIDLENVLHVAPNALANAYNMFDPQLGGASGAFVFNNMSNPVQFLCSAVTAVANVTAAETGKLCAQYLGPALNTMSFNNIPIPMNPFLAKAPRPESIIYTDPKLMPGAQPPPDSVPVPTVSDMLLPAEQPVPDAPPSPLPPVPPVVPAEESPPS